MQTAREQPKLIVALKTGAVNKMGAIPGTSEACRLMENPPPVPPKDPAYSSRMEEERPSTALTSGSKRKRQHEDDYASPPGVLESDAELSEYDEATPNKRSRSQPHQSDVSASEDNNNNNRSTQRRLVRRKKGSRNLSNLNLRHAAKAQTMSSPPAVPGAGAEVRGSKFQEGSLTDKPSERPPSAFTRLTNADAAVAEYADTLMSDYHDGAPDSPSSAGRGRAGSAVNPLMINVSSVKKDEAKGFFQFGRQFAANFHPMSLWRSIWNDSKEELMREKMEEEERKAKLKAEAEAKYAEMKRDGRFNLQPLSNKPMTNSDIEEASTPKDSAVAFSASGHSSLDHSRNTSAATMLRPLLPDEAILDKSPAEMVPESASKVVSKALKDRLHLKRPSLSNMRSDLKRMRSDLSLGGARESTLSVSPIKTDFDGFATLRKSASKADFRKQQKLTKRVSDLENKLQQAREELNDALVDASPMPKLAGRYERFTPSSATSKRPKFMPGKLPSLPSERILMAEQSAIVKEDSEAVAVEEAEPRKAMDLSFRDYLAGQIRDDQSVDHEDEETIKASRARPYPARASSLFNLDNENTENQTPPEDNEQRSQAIDRLNNDLSEGDVDMASNGIVELTNDATTTSEQLADATNYSTLDAKLRALDANVKTARRASQPKKRKSGEKDNLFKPAAESDDDAEWEKATSKKKRKSTGKTETSPPNKRATRAGDGGKQSSPAGKKTKGAAGKANVTKTSSSGQATGKEATKEEQKDEEMEVGEQYSTDELAKESDFLRTSMDSQGVPLDPVYEEEEEMPTRPAINDSAKPTSNVVTARYSRNSLRSRSSSPTKPAGFVQPGADDQAVTHAVHLTEKSHARQGSRSVSPPPSGGYSKTTVVVDETVTVVPGTNGVPKLPKGANGSFESLEELMPDASEVEVLRGGTRKDDKFEWPDDVF